MATIDTSTTTGSAPVAEPSSVSRHYRFSLEQYHSMIATGMLTERDRVERVEGHILSMSPTRPPHSNTVFRMSGALTRLAPGWCVRVQDSITLTTSEPQPDLAIARGPSTRYDARHSGAADVGLVVEIADSSLDYDRHDRRRVYAAAAIVECWIVNLVDRQVDVSRDPLPVEARYQSQWVVAATERLSLALDSHLLGELTVADILPPTS